MPPDEEGLTTSGAGRARAVLRAFLLVALVAQAAILVLQERIFFIQLARFPSRLGAPGAEAPGSSVPLLLGVLAVGFLWAGRAGSGSFTGRLGAAGLAQMALVGLAPYAVALTTGRFVPAAATAALVASGAAALATGRRGGARGSLRLRRSPWDALSGAVLVTLLAPTLFPYVHFDAKAIWACRALAIPSGFFEALAGCWQPNYPPLFSTLLALGAGDPLFEGRLSALLVVVFFALFFRDRLERLWPPAAAPALLFVLATVHVWQGAAMYYANVPLMAFLSSGLLLSLGLPADGDAPSPPRTDRAWGALCLAAAVLVRPDGIYYLGAAALAVLLSRVQRGPGLPLLPLLAAAGAWASWLLRPAWLKAMGSFLEGAANGWRALAPGPVEAAGVVLSEFLSSWQGQWLAHKGLGATLYAVVAAALADLWLSVRDEPADPRFEAEKRLYGLVTLAALAAVVACFAVFPFISDPVAAVQPFEQTDWRLCYRNFVRVGLGRMTIHLLPFFVLYVLAVLRPPPGRPPAANIERR
ncbi:MAG: hypothetical protein ACM3JH_08285 [Acidithiobacillales bacterium]